MSNPDPVTFQLAGLGLRTYPGEYPVDGITPYRHQWALHDALTAREPGTFVNDAPTGGGKTLSWLAPVISEGLSTVAVYPTNALIEDQKRNISDLLNDVDGGNDCQLLAVTSETLQNKYAEQFPEASSNGKRLSLLLKQAFSSRKTVILLTNPDIFVLLRREIYRERIGEIKRFEVAVVDEFHRATRKERNTMLFLLDEMYDTNESVCRLNHLVFLSATPEVRLEKQFEEAMVAPYYRVEDFGWRNTPHPAISRETPSTISFSPGDLPADYRAVLPPVDLLIEPAPTFGTATKMLDNEEVVLERLATGRTVIMLDGVHEIDRVYDRLCRTDLTRVERIDGFHREGVREKINTFDTLVSNSAVEVGVDFDTDQIVFSGHDAASFFQRLGRLRTRSDRSAAFAYAPPYLFHDLEPLADSLSRQWVNRTEFEKCIKSAYVDSSTPASFDWRYSAVEAYDHVEERVEDAPSDDQLAVRKTGWYRIESHFFNREQEGLSESDLQRIHGVADSELLETLKTYRGESVQTLVYNQRSQTVQTYNLPYLLRHSDISFHTRDDFLTHLPDELIDQVSRLEPYSSGYCIYRGDFQPSEIDSDQAAGRLFTYKATGELYSLLSDHPRDIRTPEVCTGLEVEVTPSVNGVDILKDDLSTDQILCYPLEGHVSQIQNQYSLGSFGFIYPLLYSEGEAAVAFGHDALYLHCRVQDRIQEESSTFDEVLDF
ncbi:type I-D CRISPR-associated helicase Cas3' [Natronolimnobius sp. AArcel1]|uniref:type I-D CRISPR-associated helicase Cas3' n=1 Tax=Natronolimnobius sp. AArcel1 TaxID=1679093 RepID=UPI0013EB63EA|nr:type I-D CRISPR-associated helicase Cas3' [Natronolimnobius sp. AArcel1]NGM71597.1 type I-D CRISPR-associated helicase Cas3' [Natronolimnobius sp. AArcel1]